MVGEALDFAYILVHQTGLADTAVAEDDDLFERLMSESWDLKTSRSASFLPHLKKDLLPRRHVGLV